MKKNNWKLDIISRGNIEEKWILDNMKNKNFDKYKGYASN